jgi:hypothetical protein
MTTTWFAVIAEHDFPEFARRVRGLRVPYAAYAAQLDRQEADWMAASFGSEAIRVRVTIADLDKYCNARGGGCAARELTGLANLKHGGQL